MEFVRTDRFDHWMRRLKDTQARARIILAIRRCEQADQMVGDIKSLGQGMFEMRLHFGPGYRIYFAQHGDALVLLLIGGDKSSQARDVTTARALLNDLQDSGEWS